MTILPLDAMETAPLMVFLIPMEHQILEPEIHTN